MLPQTQSDFFDNGLTNDDEFTMDLPSRLPLESPLADGFATRIWGSVLSDHRQFYDTERWQFLAVGVAVGALAANTHIDSEIHDKFQSSVRGATSDDWFEFLHTNKGLGEGKFSLPLFAVAWGAIVVFPDSPWVQTTSHWGERCLRTFLVGGPQLFLLQIATGGARPGEQAHESAWRPFQDDNGVSGHSFMAAIPFITAAKMTDDRRLKFLFYGASSLGALSRINDGAHYSSQALLGWWIAYLAADAIDASETNLRSWNLQCTYDVAGTGLQMSRRF